MDDKAKKHKRGSDFRDPAFYIDNDVSANPEEAHRSRQIEAAMQPSAASAMKNTMGHALRMEEAIFDIVGDENEEMVKKHRMMRWDKSKRKYVQTTVGEELKGESKSKKMRLESGQLVRSDKAKLGELYVKWQKKTNRSIGRNGVFDDAEGSPTPVAMTKTKGGKGRDGAGKDEIKSLNTIKKERAKKQNLKIKNMRKGDRRELERTQRETKSKGKGSGKFASGGMSKSKKKR
jgi:hypothetical protein